MQFKLKMIVAASVAVASGLAFSQEVIKLGHVGPTSGGIAHLGKDNENGAKLAIEELNAKGVKIGGKAVKFELLTEDDAGDPKQGTAVAQKLADQKVKGVVGHLNSGTSIPASKIYSDAGIPQISPSATNPKYTRQGFKTTFRVVADDVHLGGTLGRYAVSTLKGKSIAVIDDRTAYGQGVADEFKKAVVAAKGNVVGHEYTNDKATDFMAILTNLKAKKPDVVFFGGMDAVAGPMLRQMKSLGINAKFMVYNKEYFETYGLSAPTTWDEFLAVCATLKENKVIPIAFGNEFPWASSHYVGDFNAKLVPADVITADYLLQGEADTLFTHPGYVEALARFKLLNDEGYFNEGANALQHSLARASFVAGRTGMFYMELEEFQQVADQMGKDAFGFFPLPGGTGGEGDQNLLTGAPDGFMVSAETKHPEEAIACLRFMLSPERGAEYVRMLGIPSAVVGAVNEETALPIVVAGVEAINQASGMALWLDTDIDIRVVEVYLPGMQALLTGSEYPESVMQKVHEAAVAVQAEIAQEG